jgi:hypothetical protein
MLEERLKFGSHSLATAHAEQLKTNLRPQIRHMSFLSHKEHRVEMRYLRGNPSSRSHHQTQSVLILDVPNRTWFTVTGFREMYMNCAHVEIINGGDGLPGVYPAMFIGEINQCISQANANLVFPKAGPQVENAVNKTRWVGAPPVGLCLDPPEIPKKALVPFMPRGRTRRALLELDYAWSKTRL